MSISQLRLAALLFAVLGFLHPHPVAAQTFRGGINGAVTDPSGAVVANPQVIARNVATGVEHSSLSTGDGQFSSTSEAVFETFLTENNLSFERIEEQDSPRPAMPKAAIRALHGDIEDAFRLRQQVVIEYESLSGLKYRTTITMQDEIMHTEFEKEEHT